MRIYFLRASQVAIDLGALTLAFLLAVLIRYDWAPPGETIIRWAYMLPYVVLIEYGALLLLRVTRASWRYVGLREVAHILAAMTASTSLLLLARIAIGSQLATRPYLEQAIIPIGVIAINFVVAFFLVTGVRVARRMFGERREADKSRRKMSEPSIPTILAGAGQAGLLVARELAARPEIGLRAVAFVDDDLEKVGTVLNGIPVVGTTEQIPDIARAKGAKQVLITMASAPGPEVRRIARIAEEANLRTKIIPGIYEIVGDQINLSHIRPVAIEDLLGRKPIQLDETGIANLIRDQVVLVTGAGGSIGSELCRQIVRFAPKKLILVERNENALFEIHRELQRTAPDTTLEPTIADVTDERRMNGIFAETRPRLVFHAAAHKHVPMMEKNPGEAVKNNVGGTRMVADIAARHDVERFVLISTDKAVNPSSVMGATKRIAELYLQSIADRSRTKFVTVRFGNVLGSSGSVVPVFKDQIARGGPVTITHPDMTRFFMTIPEASQLVLQAAMMGERKEIFILDMGEPVRIVDLARDLITLSGLRPGDDIEIVFSGVRPGEKLHEELSFESEELGKTRHPKIFIGLQEKAAVQNSETLVARLLDAASSGQTDRVRSALNAAFPALQGPSRTPTSIPAAPISNGFHLGVEGDASAMSSVAK